jgi:UDP-glucose 4-epimerase
MATYLVTGGAGFIGINIVKELIAKGETVRVLDNFSTGRRENLAPYAGQLELIEGDIRSFHIVHKAVQGVDYVLHQAALPSVPRSINDPITSNDVNISGTLNLLHASVEYGVKRFVFASSSSVYGDTDVSPKHEGLTPNPKSPYAVTKLTGEYYCKVFSQLHGLQTVCLRYFNVFGPRQNPFSEYAAVIPKFLKLIKTGQQPTIYGDGEQSRDFTFIENNVRANLLACQTEGLGGLVMNIACGDSFTLNQLVQELNCIMGTNIQPNYAPARRGDVKNSQADITRARQLMGFEPSVTFRQGLDKLVAQFDE